MTACLTPLLKLKLPQRGVLFLNRSAGAQLAAGEVEELRRAAAEAGLEVIDLVAGTDCAGEIRARLQRGVTLFLAAGGDGTVHTVLQALVYQEATLGVLPLGTYNHFARDLGIPLPWREALAVALEGSTVQIDTGRINDRFFANNVSLGLYPELVTRREAWGRDVPRWKARLHAAYATVRKYPHVHLVVEAEHRREVIRTHVFLVSNNSYDLGRFGIEASRATLTAGRLSVYWLEHTSRLRLLRFLIRYAAGRLRSIPGFRSFRTAQLKVQSSRPALRVGIDGEVIALPAPLVITAAPRSLLVRVPRGR